MTIILKGYTLYKWDVISKTSFEKIEIATFNYNWDLYRILVPQFNQKQMFQKEGREVFFQNEGRWQYNFVTEIIENLVSY